MSSDGLPLLSKRVRDAAKNAPTTTRELILPRVLANAYSLDNPEGILSLGVAENSLMSDWLIDHYAKHPNLSPSDLTYGDAVSGSKRLCGHLSKLFTKYFHAVEPVLAEHMVCGAGLSAVLDQLASKLCDEGDGVLIAAPYYNGFDNDLKARSLVRPIPVYYDAHQDPTSPEVLQAFEAKLDKMKESGAQPVRAVILCNPHNPLGFCYPKETILAYCRFCEKHNLHLISDEIYALSILDNKTQSVKTPFVSLLSIDVREEAGCNPARVHVLYGMSKDFGSNGLRVGVLVSQHNPDLIRSFNSSAMLMKVASPSDVLWSSIIGDNSTLEEYLAEAQARASATLNYTIAWLEARGIEHSNPGAGVFVMVNLRPWLPKKNRQGLTLKTENEQEVELLMRVLDDGSCYIAPGAAYHHPVPGHFRLTFTLRRDVLDVGLDRMGKVLDAVKIENQSCSV